MHDLVIRNAHLVDGTGSPPIEAEIGIDGDLITEVGDAVGAGSRVIDAGGNLVTPGWVDIHTHYDGQATWDPEVSPSGWHGVTTVVMGNCGVGFAPVRPERHDWLIQLMEGVEDIPGTALAEGMSWDWETFPEFLDELERLDRVMDVAAQIPHGALRDYVMGDRGGRNQPATEADIEAMSAIVCEALEAGAVGFSTTRTVLHRAKDGQLAEGTTADPSELLGIGAGMARAGKGVFEVATDLVPPEPEFKWMAELSKESGATVTFACLQNDLVPEQWRRLLELADQANEAGAHIVPQVAGRPACLLFGWESSIHPFVVNPEYQKISDLEIDDRLAELRRPEVREAILGARVNLTGFAATLLQNWGKIFPLGDPPDYEPEESTSVLAIANRESRTPEEVTYDLMMQRDGRELLYFPLLGYSHGDFGALREMLVHNGTVLGLGDGGAHCGILCDASLPTYMLTHWVRDRKRGDALPLESVVSMQTRRTAELYGFRDRGVVRPGYLADINLIDFDKLELAAPEMVHDLPSGGRRLIQRAGGYMATVKRGSVTFEDGEATGARPGRLVRGAQPAPS